jgi:hypothetical protein
LTASSIQKEPSQPTTYKLIFTVLSSIQIKIHQETHTVLVGDWLFSIKKLAYIYNKNVTVELGESHPVSS